MAESLDIPIIDTSDPGAGAQIDALRKKLSPAGDVVSERGRQKTVDVFGQPLTPQQTVERICRDVREQGLPAVLDYTAKLDGAEITSETLRVSAEALQAAHDAAEPEFLKTIRSIRESIWLFQTKILHQDVVLDSEYGGYLRQRYLPLRRAGICVPGGAAAYPSTVLMTAVPAQAAGVAELAVVAPPTKFGSYNQDLLATCHELGIQEVYRVGGAQGVAALAYGIEGIPRVDKIVGPGNMFVALAKKHVFGDVDIDSIAGPSEVIVLADEGTPPEYIAADMIAQAEHAPGSSVLITWDKSIINQVVDHLRRQLAQLERGEEARQSLEEFGALVVVADRDEAARLANEMATEHLHIQCDDPEELVEAIHHAGAIFVGPYSPVALGDYAAGPSHVLPTGATARFASGLSSNDFLRSGSVIQFSKEGFEVSAADVLLMANKEGLTGHAGSVHIRRAES